MPIITKELRPSFGTPRKWDWGLLQALYVGGMEDHEIFQIPKFRGLSKSFYAKKKSEGRWRELRDQAKAEGTGQICKELSRRLIEAVKTHNEFMLDALKEERDIYNKTADDKGGKFQIERLTLLDKLDLISRRSLGMDDMKPLNETQRNLGILIGLRQNGGPKLKGSQTITIAVTENDTGQQDDSDQEAEKPINGRDITAEVAALIIETRKAQYEEAVDKITEEADLPAAPGLRTPTPFKIKEQVETLVNEKNESEEGQKDLVDVLREGGYDARVISEGTQDK